MENANLSRCIFEKHSENISVIEVKNVFWSDWGSGARVLETLDRLGKTPRDLAERARSQRIPSGVEESRHAAV